MAEPGTPDWWLDRLYKRLRDRRPQIQEWDDWYSGDHPPPQAYASARPLLQRLLECVGANFLSLVVNAAHERMHIEGFKVNGTINDRIWGIWQGNNFDAKSRQVFQESMALSEAYIMVDPTRNRAGFPTVTPEHPEQCITERVPGSQDLAAGIKVWLNDLGERPMRMASVILPDKVVTYSAPTRGYDPGFALSPRWEFQETLSGDNTLGEVSLIPFPNRPRMLKENRPEFYQAIPIQRRINSSLLHRMVNQETGSFKQKWTTGMEIPVDPLTGEQVEPFNVAIDKLFMAEDPTVRFGQFEPEDIAQLREAVQDDAQHIAAIVPTPPDYLLGKMSNISAEGLKAAQASLISRIKMHGDFQDEPLETVARLMLKANGDDVPNVSSMTTVRRNPEFRTEGELVDALVKMSTLNVPRQAVWERWGATPDEITEWTRQLNENAADPVTAALLAGLNPSPTPPGTPNAPAGG